MTCVFLALRWALAVVWVAAGVGKAGGTSSVASSIREYGMLPDGIVVPIAKVLPTAEIVLGVALAAGVLPAVGGWVAAASFCALAGAMAWNLAHGRTFDCGCGLTAHTPISWQLVGRNLILAGVSAAVAVGPSGGLALLRGGSQVPAGGPASTALIAMPMIVLIVAVIARLLATIQPLQLWQAARQKRPASTAGNRGLSIVQVAARGTSDEGVT